MENFAKNLYSEKLLTQSQYKPEMSKWQTYEYFKKKIRETAKSQAEYEKRIKTLAERLNV
jgi:hypothetical protein